jgi:hypothetical protein
MEYWIQHLYAIDFFENDNAEACDAIADAWEKYLVKNFGEDWDEI